MKEVSSFEIIDNPAFVKKVQMPELGGQASLHEDGSVFIEKTGRYYAPEKGDSVFWQMRQDFDKAKSIKPGDRYIQSKCARSFVAQRYGMVA
jgi:hypothetical protein